MNPAQLLEHFGKISDAPDAIPRLRRFIVGLAVRGKLLPQEPKDLSAADLLGQIRDIRQRFVTNRVMRAKKISDAIKPNFLQNSTPKGWTWVFADELWDFENGDRSSNYPSRDQFVASGIPFINAGHLVDGKVAVSDMNYITRQKFNQLGGGKLKRGDQLYCLRGSLGKHALFEHDTDAAIASSLVILRPVLGECVPYLSIYLDSDIAVTMLRRFDNGSAQPNLSSQNLRRYEIPLPPLAEQRRIVARVDELKALCDQLEAAQSKRDDRRDRLVAASLARLNTPDPDSFEDDARFALASLSAVTTRPDQVKQLRQAILNLAVRGKLVAQNPKDAPIHLMLKKASERRAALIRAKKIRHKKLDGYDDLVASATLPASWAVGRLGDLVDPENTISYGVLVPGEDVSDGIPFVRAQDLSLSAHPVRPNKTISPEVEKAYSRTRLKGGEILVCVVGSIGKLGIVPQSWAGANIARAVARIAPIPEISREYLLIVLRGEPVQSYFTQTTRTLAQPTLNVGLIEQTPIPVPPLAEQRRIVAKVDELMTLCDRIEASLTGSEERRSGLLTAILSEALRPIEERDEAA